MRSWIWIPLASTVVLTTTVGSGYADLTARVIPSKLSLTVKPGQPVGRDITVQNMGGATVVVSTRLADWTMSERGELDVVAAGTTPATLQGLVTFTPAEFSLEPLASGVIHVTMQLPARGPATRWGVLLSEVRPATWPETPSGPRAVAELGTTLYLSSIPPDRIHTELTGMDVHPAGDKAFAVAVRVRNAGERHLYSNGAIAVRDSAGHEVAADTLGTGVVLPGTDRTFTWTHDAPIAPGLYTVSVTLDTGEPELIVGETEFRWPMPGPPALRAQQDSR